MGKRFILRNENFGATLFDRKKLIHKFLTYEELKRGMIEWVGINVSFNNMENWVGDLENTSTNIIYSPIRVYFELTKKCNLCCKSCFNESGKPLKSEMRLEEVLKSLDGMRKDNIFDIRFTGGEITQGPAWFSILKYAKDLDFSVSINTNGAFDDPSIIDKLLSLDLEQITISIDGLKEINDYIRGKGSFEKTLNSLKELHKGGAILRINTLITKSLFKEAEAMCGLASKYCTEINFFNPRLIGRARKYLADKILSFDELAVFNKLMDKIVPRYPNLNILYREAATTYNSIK